MTPLPPDRLRPPPPAENLKPAGYGGESGQLGWAAVTIKGGTMVDLAMHTDETILSTGEVAAWTGWTRRTVLSLPGLPSLDHIRSREAQFRAGDVKRAILGDPRPGVRNPLERAVKPAKPRKKAAKPAKPRAKAVKPRAKAAKPKKGTTRRLPRAGGVS